MFQAVLWVLVSSCWGWSWPDLDRFSCCCFAQKRWCSQRWRPGRDANSFDCERGGLTAATWSVLIKQALGMIGWSSCLLVGWSSPYFGPELNLSTNTELIVIKFDSDILGAQRKKPAGRHFSTYSEWFFNIYLMDWHKMFHDSQMGIWCHHEVHSCDSE